MSIVQKLYIAAGAAAALGAVALFANTQVAKAAHFHELNVQHYQYTFELTDRLAEAVFPPAPASLDAFERTIRSVRAQPEACLSAINIMDRAVMNMIGTALAIQLCHDDIAAADEALAAIGAYRSGAIDAGQLRAALETVNEIFKENSLRFVDPVQRTGQFIVWSMCLLTIMMGAGSAGYVFMTARSIARPLNGLNCAVEALGRGEVVERIPGAERGDELGSLAKALEGLREVARQRLSLMEASKEQEAQAEARASELSGLVASFEREVAEVMEVARRALSSVETAAETVSETSNAIDARAGRVNSSAEQAHGNVGSSSSAAVELAAGVEEISGQTTRAASLTRAAAERAQTANSSVAALVDSAREIAGVVQIITDIAEQTNLLALNATIEASRAGEAGRGFAVVANEVKTLASQTANATSEIDGKINAMTRVVETAASSIEAIVNEIREADEVAASIAGTLEQQSAATNEISRNASDATGDVAALLEEMKDLVSEAGRSRGAADRLRTDHGDMAASVGRLSETAERFFSAVRRLENAAA